MDFITENILHKYIICGFQNNEQLSLVCVCQCSQHTQQEENQMHMLSMSLAALGCVKIFDLLSNCVSCKTYAVSVLYRF